MNESRLKGLRRFIRVAVPFVLVPALAVLGTLVFDERRHLLVSLGVTVLALLLFEAGFLVGSLSAILSNFYFGQGPWTPFQMLAWGLVGLIAGFLATPLKKSRVALIVYGVLAGVLFSMIMDVWSVLWYRGYFDPSYYFVAVGTSLPHMLLYAASNAFFLWWLSKPIGDKLQRLHVRYGV